ncbi:MAG: hypothetical protein QS99_C0015G0006 [archaeon GW2011_AR4]|nr:MAG: hypothetical protein QS99_C0015G0006 [archaeon GW2011_AR4]
MMGKQKLFTLLLWTFLFCVSLFIFIACSSQEEQVIQPVIQDPVVNAVELCSSQNANLVECMGKSLNGTSLPVCSLFRNSTIVEKRDDFTEACYTYFALQQNSAALCNRIPIFRNGYSTCVSLVAYQENDTGLCNNLKDPFQIDWCIYNFVANTMNDERVPDPAWCDLIVNEKERLHCQAKIGIPPVSK